MALTRTCCQPRSPVPVLLHRAWAHVRPLSGTSSRLRDWALSWCESQLVDCALEGTHSVLPAAALALRLPGAPVYAIRRPSAVPGGSPGHITGLKPGKLTGTAPTRPIVWCGWRHLHRCRSSSVSKVALTTPPMATRERSVRAGVGATLRSTHAVAPCGLPGRVLVLPSAWGVVRTLPRRGG